MIILTRKDKINMPMKWAIKYKKRWFKELLGLINLRMILCIPYPMVTIRINMISIPIFCKMTFKLFD